MLKKIILLAMITVAVKTTAQVKPVAYNSNTTLNYVRTWDVRIPVTNASTITSRPVNEVMQTTMYTDALGRPLETVIKQGSLVTSSNVNKDMVSPVHYDNLFGAELLKFLPFASTTADGQFKYDPFEEQKNFYDAQLTGQGDSWYYNKTDVDNTAMMRSVKNLPAGNSWVGNGRGTTTKYFNNTATDKVKIWKVTDVAGGFGNYQITGDAVTSNYAAGELTKTITEDENGKQVIEFKNKDGIVLLKKVQIGTGTDNGSGTGYPGWLATYYIYDDYNSLRAVLQPKAVAILDQANWVTNTNVSGNLLNELVFRYEYDGSNRMTMKKVPGAAPAYMVYDKWDRLVLTQDGNLRNSNKWIFTKYDYQNRPVMTGFYTDAINMTQAAMQGQVNSLMNSYPVALFESTNSSSIGYTTTVSFPSLSNPQLLSITFYDNYNWASNYNSIYATRDNSNDALFYSSGTSLYAQPLTQSSKTKAMVTGTVTYVLNSSSNQKLVSSIFYDDKGRAIQTKADNTSAGMDITTTQYSFSGQPLMSLQQHQKTSSSAFVKVISKIGYDALGRLQQVKKQVIQTGGVQTPEKIIVKNEYDALGQLKNKILSPEFNNGTGLENLNYEYNVRGWLLGVNRDFIKEINPNSYFGFELGYDKANTAVAGSMYNNPQYNGNIEGTVWKSKGDNEKRKYDFTYDNLNRLLAADFNQYTYGSFNKSANVDFSIKMGNGTNTLTNNAYDENGNILQMQQWGLKINNSEKIDDLNYTYYNGGNKLQNVIDFKELPTSQLGDFKTSANHIQYGTKSAITTALAFTNSGSIVNDYGYDINGNMITDRNKDLSGSTGIDQASGAITYNHLNLPYVITVAGKGTITYTYDASGNKLKKTTTETAVVVTHQGNPLTTTVTTTTDYTAGFVYESKSYSNSTLNTALGYTDKLQFTGHEEGRVRANYMNNLAPNTITSFAFDYMVKDHLGNVRMVLTDEPKIDHYPTATVEANALADEQTYYEIPNPTVTVVDKPTPLATESAALLDYINDNGTLNAYTFGTPAATSLKMMKLNASANNKTGMSMVLKVMAGDKLDILAKSYYQYLGGTVTNTPFNAASLISSFLSIGGAANPAVVHGGTSAILNNNTTGTVTPLNSFINNAANTNTYNNVKAGICYIFFDEQFNLVSCRFDPVYILAAQGGHGSTGGPQGGLKPHFMQNVPVTKNGYLYVYCSNESNIDVFFDNLEVIHTRGQILEETHYYPFGLTMAGISSKAAGGIQNKIKYNNMELQNGEFSDGSGLEMYEYKYRFYDHQIGRFISQDALATKYPHYAPYQFAGNQVPNAIDLDGLEEFRVNDNKDGTKSVVVHRVDAPFSVQYNGQKLDAFPQQNMNDYYQNNTIVKSEVDGKGNNRISSVTQYEEGVGQQPLYDNVQGSKDIAYDQPFRTFEGQAALPMVDVTNGGTKGATILQNNNLEGNSQNNLTTGIPIGTDLLSFNASSMGSQNPATFTITNTNANGTSTGVGPYVINGGTGVGSPAMISVVPGTYLNVSVTPGAGGGGFKYDVRTVDDSKPQVQRIPMIK